MTKMTPKERALYDAQADHEAWSLAHEILEPWVQTTKPIGSDELTRVMEGALSEVEAEIGRTLDVLEACRKEAGIPTAYLWTLEYLAHSRGFSGAEEVARRAAEIDPRYTARDLLESPPGGYGTALDAVLEMDGGEKVRLTQAFRETFLNPSRLKKEAERDPSAEILSAVNGNLGESIDLLDGVPPEAFGSEDDYFKAKGAIAEAGQLVARAQQRLAERSRPAV
ncbi:MAG: hypothetical protein M3R38_33710 [Actinomycetota bacterium]|nr:hypothetical protein [Actinomycetota bacterium]